MGQKNSTLVAYWNILPWTVAARAEFSLKTQDIQRPEKPHLYTNISKDFNALKDMFLKPYHPDTYIVISP